MPQRPKVSVLVPTYNYAGFLPEAIRSVLDQRFGDFELIVADDASGDGTAEAVRPFRERDGRVRFHRHERNIGMVRNWNWCLRRARGDYVKFLFGDDKLASPEALGRLVAMLDGEPRAAVAATARVVIDRDSRVCDVWNGFGTGGRWEGREAVARCLRGDSNLIGEPSAVLFRRSAAGRGFDPALRQLVDLEMWFELLRHGDLVYDPEPLCAFRRHTLQQTAVNRRSQVGVAEGVIVRARYADRFAEAHGVRAGSWAMKRHLFRLAHYALKDHPDTSRAAGVMPAVARRLPPRWYFACWLAHRAGRPFSNLRRHWDKVRPPAKPVLPTAVGPPQEWVAAD